MLFPSKVVSNSDGARWPSDSYPPTMRRLHTQHTVRQAITNAAVPSDSEQRGNPSINHVQLANKVDQTLGWHVHSVKHAENRVCEVLFVHRRCVCVKTQHECLCNGLAEGRGHVLGAALLRSVCSSQVFMQDSKRQ